jgi:26S proteasome regulatory subunit N5
LTRLSQLLDLAVADAEDNLSQLIVNKTIYGRIDRPSGIVTFASKKHPDQVLNEWSGQVNELLKLISKTNHLITKEEMVHSIIKPAATAQTPV